MLPLLRSVSIALTRRSTVLKNLSSSRYQLSASRSLRSSCQPLRCKNPGSNPSTDGAHEVLGEMIKPTDFQKKVLVWGKLYKSIEEVPDRVSAVKMRKARDLFRIRVNIIMGILTLVGCILMIKSGQRLRDSGDSLDVRGKAQLEEWAKKGAEERAAGGKH